LITPLFLFVSERIFDGSSLPLIVIKMLREIWVPLVLATVNLGLWVMLRRKLSARFWFLF
jgi:hypothetical protein